MANFNWIDDELNYLEDNVLDEIANLPNDLTVNQIIS